MNFKSKKKSRLHEISEGYDLYSSHYDEDLIYLNSFEKDVLLKFLGDLRGKKVLDAGCGTGRLIRDLKNLGGFVTGIDISEKMVEKAKNKFPDLEFVIGNVDGLPFDDESFDVVVASFLVVHLKDPMQFFAEAYRVLKLGGLFILTNINQKKAPKLKTKEAGEIVIRSFYHRPQDIISYLENDFFEIEREEFVEEKGIWINQVVKAVKK